MDRCKRGFSLLEVMVAVLVLAVLVLGSGTILYRAGSTILYQKNKRVAIEAATRRMEQLRALPYGSIRPASTGIKYINEDDNLVSSQPSETVSINGTQQPIVVAAERIDLSSPSGEYVRFEVRVQHRAGDDAITMATIKR